MSGRPLAALVLLAAVFVAGLVYVFHRYFETGSGYPLYSSLRSDPEGVTVFYESLGRIKGLEVSRNFQPLDQLNVRGATIFVLDTPGPLTTAASLERLAAAGNRIVVSVPEDYPESRESMEGPGGMALPAGQEVIEKPYEGGSLVVARSHLFANRTLASRWNPETLAGIAGPNRRMIFDESHFGLVETGSIVELVRRYRLYGFVLGAAVCALLFLWRSTSPFPPLGAAPAADRIAGHASASGLIVLLQRNIPPGDLPRTAFSLWARTHGRTLPEARRQEAERLAKTPGDPLEALAAIHTVLRSKGAV